MVEVTVKSNEVVSTVQIADAVTKKEALHYMRDIICEVEILRMRVKTCSTCRYWKYVGNARGTCKLQDHPTGPDHYCHDWGNYAKMG